MVFDPPILNYSNLYNRYIRPVENNATALTWYLENRFDALINVSKFIILKSTQD